MYRTCAQEADGAADASGCDLWADATRAAVEFIAAENLAAGQRVLDVGCAAAHSPCSGSIDCGD